MFHPQHSKRGNRKHQSAQCPVCGTVLSFDSKRALYHCDNCDARDIVIRPLDATYDAPDTYDIPLDIFPIVRNETGSTLAEFLFVLMFVAIILYFALPWLHLVK